MAGVSASAFVRESKRLTGTGFENHLQARRVEKARQLLETSDLPVSRITQECGFKSGPPPKTFFSV